MQKIIIENFGPIDHLEFEINDLMLFIGPQASGKSTISKTVYFFKSLRDDLIRFSNQILLQSANDYFEKDIYINFIKTIRNKFVLFFGTTKHMSPFRLKYYYSEDKHVTLSLKAGYVQILFSAVLQERIKNTLHVVENYKQRHSQQTTSALKPSEFVTIDSDWKVLVQMIENEINELFEDNRIPIFVPAGRSLLATLSDQLQNVDTYHLDFLMKEFIERTRHMRPLFKGSFDDIINDRKKLTLERINTPKAAHAADIIYRILKGRYAYDSDGEKIYYNNSEYTKLRYSSSGQQESIWILLIVFISILDNYNVFVVFEEPEAHLHPNAQKEIVDLLALLLNSGRNQLVITTHSPYILSSLNNLLYAGNIGLAKPDQVSQVVDENLWISSSKTSAFYINPHSDTDYAIKIIDPDLNLIKVEIIDLISSKINATFDKLFELDN